MDNKYIIDQIDKYLDNKMTEEERIRFESKVEKDNSLKEALNLHRLEREVVQKMIANEIKENVQNWGKEVFKESWDELEHQGGGGKRFFLFKHKKSFALAASFLLLCLFSFLFMGQQYSNEKIYASSLEVASPEGTLLSTLRGNQATSYQLLIDQAKGFYSGKDFEKAIEILNQIPEQDESIIYFKAHNYLALKQFDQAADLFRTVALQDGELKSDSEFYLLLSYLGNDRLDTEFENLLSKIVNDQEHPFQKDAQILKSSLDNFWRSFSL